MRVFYLLICLFQLNCIARVDWDNEGKNIRTFTYDHIHEGNLTKAEIARNPKTPNSASNGMYRIKTQEEIYGAPVNNCVSKIAKCMSDCGKSYDPSSSIFALQVAILQSKREGCYSECYNEVTPGCDYPKKRIPEQNSFFVRQPPYIDSRDK